MTTKQKRIIFGIVFFLATIAIAFALYWTFFAPTPEEEVPERPAEEKPAEEAQLPEAEEAEVTEPTGPGEEEPAPAEEEPAPAEEEEEEPVTQPVSDNIDYVSLNDEGQTRFYNEEDGRFYRLVNGELKPLSDKQFFNAESVKWAPNEDKAIIEYPDGANVYYNFETKQQETLPQHWTEFSFSEDGSQVVSKNMSFSEENRWLVKSSPDGSSIEGVAKMGDNADKVDVNWSPNGEIVGFSKTGGGSGDSQEVIPVGEENQNLQSISVPGRAMRHKWSPSGEKLLYSVYNSENNYKPELWAVTANPGEIGQNRTRLNINTWANKCAFADENTVYCGVPTSLPEGAGFEPSLADDIEDNIYKINIRDKSRTQISTGDQSFTVESIQVNESNNQLIITGKNQSGLFKIDI